MSHKAATNSSASCVVIYSQLSACTEKTKLFKDHQGTHGHLTSLKKSHNKSSLGYFKHQYLSELLVSVYSYHLMVKNMWEGGREGKGESSIKVQTSLESLRSISPGLRSISVTYLLFGVF